MYEIIITNKFKRSLKRSKKRGLDLSELEKIMLILQHKGELPAHYKPHKLTGNYNDCMECHIKPDWLLIWKQNNTALILIMIDTGSHTDLF